MRAVLQRELRLAADRLDRVAGEQIGDRSNDLHRHRLAVDGEQAFQTAGVEVGGQDRPRAGGQVADRSRQDDGVGVAAIGGQARLDLGDLDPELRSTQRLGQRHRALAIGTRGRDGHVDRQVAGRQSQRSDGGEVTGWLGDRQLPDRAGE